MEVSYMKETLNWHIVVIQVVGELLFLYGFLGWVYGVLIQLTHPEWLPIQLSHLTPWIRVDTFTIISFIIGAIGFFIWRSFRELANSDQK
jgi:hypothetical protein